MRIGSSVVRWDWARSCSSCRARPAGRRGARPSATTTSTMAMPKMTKRGSSRRRGDGSRSSDGPVTGSPVYLRGTETQAQRPHGPGSATASTPIEHGRSGAIVPNGTSRGRPGGQGQQRTAGTPRRRTSARPRRHPRPGFGEGLRRARPAAPAPVTIRSVSGVEPAARSPGASMSSMNPPTKAQISPSSTPSNMADTRVRTRTRSGVTPATCSSGRTLVSRMAAMMAPTPARRKVMRRCLRPVPQIDGPVAGPANA